MDEQSKAALDLLVQNGYLEIVKGKYRVSAKLNVIPTGKETSQKLTDMDWEGRYILFITECKVPNQGESGTGDVYPLNKYSTEGMKAFRKMLEHDGIKYDILVRVTQSYYKIGTNRYKKKIGNYITEGLWRMDYEVIKDQTVEQQQQTIQQQLNESKPFTRDRIG